MPEYSGIFRFGEVRDLLRKLYIHIPFCARKCNYCDFNSYGNMLFLQDDYTDALIREVMSLEKCDIDTIYFGGGTPSFIKAENISKIMNTLKSHFNVYKNAEITLEANPATLSEQKLLSYKNSGINRISLGVQSFVDEELKILGRLHSAEDIKETFDLIRKCGFNNVSLDLMFGVPHQTIESFEKSINEALSLNPEHISCYGLKVEEGTPFYTDFENGKYTYTDDDAFLDMYDHLRNKLTNNGYNHYEISNFAKVGYRSRHNTAYWKCEEYYGVGAGASSYVNSVRYTNVYDIHKYIEDFTRKTEHEVLSQNDKMSEFVILGLRLLQDGIDAVEFEKRFGINIYDVFGDALNKHIENGFIEKRGNSLILAEKAYYVSNAVMVDFI